jgi:hypothetical protein
MVRVLLQGLMRVVFSYKVHDVLMPLLLGRHANQRIFRLTSDGLWVCIYRKAAHPPPPEEAYDCARAFVD